jgi:uncharacterized protein (TIGR00369 family)
VTSTVRADDGRELASASAICAVLRPAPSAEGDPTRRDAGPAAGAPSGETADGPLTITHGPARHPLLEALGAEEHRGGETVTVRLRPPGWLGNRIGRAHGAACCALADAAIATALARKLPTGSASHTLSLDLTLLRSLPLDREVVAAATVRHVGRRLAVVDVELGQDDGPPCVLVRATVSRTTHRRAHP